MTLQTLSQLGEFFGGFGVIISLVYLAMQVRSNTSSQRADMTARVLERLAAQQHTFGFDEQANKFWMGAIQDATSLSVEDRARFLWATTEFFSSIEFLMQQHDAGNIEVQVWLRWSDTMDYWLTFPGIRAAWLGRATPYTDDFTRFMEERLAADDYSFNLKNHRSFALTGKIPDS